MLGHQSGWLNGATKLQFTRLLERHWSIVIGISESIEHSHVHTQTRDHP